MRCEIIVNLDRWRNNWASERVIYIFKYWSNRIMRFWYATLWQNCNCRYLNNIKTMSAIVRDELVKPIDRTVWHVEHVLKFPNSRHLRYHGHDMSWIHYYVTYLCLGTCLFLLLYLGYILYNETINIFIKIRYVNNLKRWINNLKRKLDWCKFANESNNWSYAA